MNSWTVVIIVEFVITYCEVHCIILQNLSTLCIWILCVYALMGRSGKHLILRVLGILGFLLGHCFIWAFLVNVFLRSLQCRKVSHRGRVASTIKAILQPRWSTWARYVVNSQREYNIFFLKWDGINLTIGIFSAEGLSALPEGWDEGCDDGWLIEVVDRFAETRDTWSSLDEYWKGSNLGDYRSKIRDQRSKCSQTDTVFYSTLLGPTLILMGSSRKKGPGSVYICFDPCWYASWKLISDLCSFLHTYVFCSGLTGLPVKRLEPACLWRIR